MLALHPELPSGGVAVVRAHLVPSGAGALARQRTLLTRLARSRVIAVSSHTLGRQAHWFYEDFCRTTAQGRAQRSFSLREFAELMFEQHPSLEQHKVRKELARPARGVWLRCLGCTRRPRADWTASTSNSRHTRCAASCAAPTAVRLTAYPAAAAQRSRVRRHHGEPRVGQVPHGERLEVWRELGLSEGEGAPFSPAPPSLS